MIDKRILILDDEEFIRRALSDYLEDEGYTTSSAADGYSGLRKYQAEKFDVVLVDLRMPNVDGLQVIRTLHNKNPDLPVIVISGTGVMEDVIAAMREGAWDYLSKPIPDMDQIKVVIDRVLEKSKLLLERQRYQSEIEQLNKSLAEEVQRQTADLMTQNRSLRALNRVAHVVSHSMEIDAILENALDAAVSAINADAGVIRLLNPATGLLYLTAVSGISQTYRRTAQPLELGKDLAGSVVQQGNVRMGRIIPPDSWLHGVENLHADSYVFVPLRTGDRVWHIVEADRSTPPIVGALGVFSQKAREYTNQDIHLLTTIGSQIGIAVTRVQYAANLRMANEKLASANAKLLRLDDLREQFIQNVAHELRTPLALVQGYVALLEEGDLSMEQQQTALSVASQRIQSLVEIVETITTLQDLGSEEFKIEAIQPIDLVQTVCRMTAQKASSRNIALVFKPPASMPTIHADYTKLTQALYQLLDNACKFSPENTKVEIGMDLREEDAFICFWVTDHGIGIPLLEQERIFELFYQVDGSATRRFGGMGMGLALVKEIADVHQGTVEVDSVVGKGSTFTLKIPVLQSAAF
jgi:signal transduction histidine kinase